MDHWDEFLLSAWAYLCVGGAALLLAAGCLAVAPRLVRRPLPFPRLRRGRWSGLEVVFAFLYYSLLVPLFVLGLLDGLGFYESVLGTEPNQYRKLNLSGPLTAALTLALILTLLFGFSRTRPSHFGLTAARWPANVVLGVGTFLVLTPLALGLFYLATVFLPGKQEHALEDLVKGPFRAWEWLFLLFQTVVAAPLLEEILFRGLLLGWLRRASLAGHTMLIVITVVSGADLLFAQLLGSPQAPPVVSASRFTFAVGLALVYFLWLSALWQRHAPPAPEDAPWPGTSDERADDGAARPDAPSPRRDVEAERRQADWRRANAGLALYGSAMLFAVAHGAWPSPLPLLVLALGLGWLAQRTQSLVGPIVCHALFNSVACLVLYWSAGKT